MYRGRKDVFEFDGTVYELYLLLGIEPEFYRDGVRKKTINELLRVRPLSNLDGYEVPRVLVIKNRAHKLRVINSNRLRYVKYRYKRRRNQTVNDLYDEFDESFLIYLDKLKHQYPKHLASGRELSLAERAKQRKRTLPKKFAKGSKVKLVKANKVSKKFIAKAFAKGSRVSLRPKLILKNRPPLPKKFAKKKVIEKLAVLNKKTNKKEKLVGVKFKKKPKTMIRTAKKKVPTKSKSASSAKKTATKAKAKPAKKKGGKSKSVSIKLGLNKSSKIKVDKIKYKDPKATFESMMKISSSKNKTESGPSIPIKPVNLTERERLLAQKSNLTPPTWGLEM